MTTDLALAQACAATYLSTATARWEDPEKLIHAHLYELDDSLCVAFEGTTDWQEWAADFAALEVPILAHPRLGALHLGIAGGVLRVWTEIAAHFEGLGWPAYDATGHSKGGGEVLIFHGLMKTIGHPPRRTRAFEAPRVGGAVLRDYLGGEEIVQYATHNHHGRDVITLVPFGPTWCDVRGPVVLPVPDELDIPAKHRIAAVIGALEKYESATT